MVPAIFCPVCHTLVLAEPRCGRCGWERPQPPGQGEGALVWQARLPAPLASGLTLAGDRLLALDATGKLHALDAAWGKPTWPQPVDLGPWRVHERVVVAGDLVLVGPTDSAPIPSGDKAVLAFDLHTGMPEWRRSLNVRQVSTPAVSGDTLFVATADGYGHALNLADGAVRWRQPIGGVFLAAPAVAGGLVYFGSEKGVLTALQINDGAKAWTFEAEAMNEWTRDLCFTPLVADGVLYVTCWNRRCYALDAVAGTLIWISEPTVKSPPITPPVPGESSVFFCGRDHYVYCLNRATGATRWRTALPKKSQVAPLLIDDRLFVAAVDHHVYVLDPATGELTGKPLFETDGHVLTGWAEAGGVLYLGDDEGRLYAVIACEHKEAVDPQALERDHQWEDAASAYALAGNLARAASIYQAELGQPGSAAQLYQAAGMLPEAALGYQAAGSLERAREIYGQMGDCLHVAEISLQMNDLQAAAQAYESAEKWDQAGWCYYELAKYPQAAAMYERAAEAANAEGNSDRAKKCWSWAGEAYKRMKQPEKAVQLFKLAGKIDAAEDVIKEVKDLDLVLYLKRVLLGSAGLALWLNVTGRYRQAADEYAEAGMPLEAAAAYEKAGDHIPAAKAYIQAGEPLKAAANYEQAREYVLAAEQYQAAGKLVEAGEILLKVPNYDAAGKLFRQAGDLRRAAETYLKANDQRAAAELFEKLEAWPEAAAAWEGYRRWEKAAQAWERAGQWLQGAAAWVKADNPLRAGGCYWRGAELSEREQSDDPEAAARLYDLARQAYADCGDSARVVECELRRRHLRKQPWLEVEMPEAQEFVRDRSDALVVYLHNRGWGTARQIDFAIKESDHFQANLSVSSVLGINSLAPDVPAQSYRLYVIPRQAGNSVPLPLIISYCDARGAPMPAFVRSFDLKVNEPLGSATPTTQEIHYHGPVIQSPQVSDVKVVSGDMVNIERHGATPAAAPTPPAAADVPYITCSQCATRQPATAFKCGGCGIPFARCPQCHMAQSQRGAFCEHCRTPLR